MNKKLFALLVTLILWGSGFAGVRAGLRGYSPEHLVALRFAIDRLPCPGRLCISDADAFAAT